MTSPQYREGEGERRWLLLELGFPRSYPACQEEFVGIPQRPGTLLPPKVSVAEPQAQPISWCLSPSHTPRHTNVFADTFPGSSSRT